MTKITTEAWVLYPGTGNAPECADLVKEQISFDVADDELLVGMIALREILLVPVVVTLFMLGVSASHIKAGVIGKIATIAQMVAMAVAVFDPYKALPVAAIAAITGFAAAIGLFRLPVFFLYVAAAMAGVALGGIWSADRPYMLKLTPPERIGEFYGLYGMVGRFSAVSGPILWGLVMYVSINGLGLNVLTGQSIAILTLLGMIVTSVVILRPIRV